PSSRLSSLHFTTIGALLINHQNTLMAAYMTKDTVAALRSVLIMTISAAYSGSSLYCWAIIELFTAAGIAEVMRIAWAVVPSMPDRNSIISATAGPTTSLERLAAIVLKLRRLNFIPAIGAPSRNSTIPIIAFRMESMADVLGSGMPISK